ncbi:MAG: LacI family DNA-binding transcriptional regulator [Chloroflexi bacterium]|nr:LacI family DNA-binding transcriptional regulator [Chloroflexota bacterium]
MATDIRGIAKHLGLSVSTVSKALNGYDSVSETTRQRIIEVAHEYNYYPSRAARSLRRNKTEKIGLVLYTHTPLSNRSSEYYFEVIRGAATASESMGYNLILYLTVGNQLDRLMNVCRSHEVDCLILMLGTGDLDSPVKLLKKEKIPFIVLNKHPKLPNIAYVVSDHEKGAKDAVEHLIELGHQRIAYLGREDDPETSGDRFAGYRQALLDHGIALDESLVAYGSSQAMSAYRAMKELLERPLRPTAVFAYSDGMAIEAIHAISECGLVVPNDISVVGFDDLRVSSVTIPPLTTVRQHLTELGKQAIEALLQQLEDKPPMPVQRTIPVELIVRQSSASPALP